VNGGVRRLFSVVGGSKMLVGVELPVVQLKGEEPNDSCDELHRQNTFDV
jgi:phosphoribosylanthranilate isomerase